MEVNAFRIRHILKTLRRRGADQRAIFQALQNCAISAEEISPDAKLFSAEKEATFIEEACKLLDDTTFGAQAGLELGASTSLEGNICKYSRRLRSAIENTSRFHEIVDPSASFSLRTSREAASFEIQRVDPPFGQHRRHTEFLLFGALSGMRAVTQVDFLPIEVRFQHEEGAYSDLFQALTGSPVVFGADRTEICLSLSCLDLPIPTYNASPRERLTSYGERLAEASPAHTEPLRAKVERLIAASLPGRMLPAEEVAADLGMSHRTFVRRLKDEGASYRDVVDELRCDLAKAFISDGIILSEISFLLGYMDLAAFSTAFKRWTGVSPSTYRDGLAQS